MDQNIHHSIVSFIRKYSGLSNDCMKELQLKFPEHSYDLLYSILSQEYQSRMKCNYTKSEANKAKFWDMYKKAIMNCESPGIIVRMSEKYNICPCLMAKLIIPKYFEEINTDMKKLTQNKLNGYIKNTNTIPDTDLAYEVFLCTLVDNIYSPLANVMKMSLGQQYEIKLYKEAVSLGLAFQDEESLRKCGYDKTPDCKLDVPIAIDGFIVNWIESKALFADQDCHNEYKKNQYMSYWNRFGPGLVIYWFGFLETIVEPSNKRFIIRDHLPKNIVHMCASDEISNGNSINVVAEIDNKALECESKI